MQESKNDDNSIIELTELKMEELNLMYGDQVMLKGKKRRETICIAFQSEDKTDFKDGEIRMNKGTRKNLRVKLGDQVTVSALTELPNATQIKVLPFAEDVEGIAGDLTATFIVPYFRDAFRPVMKGDTFTVRGNMKAVEFKVVEVAPGNYGTVTDKTMVYTEG